MLRKRSMGSRACNISARARLSVGKNNRTSPPLISQRDACSTNSPRNFSCARIAALMESTCACCESVAGRGGPRDHARRSAGDGGWAGSLRHDMLSFARQYRRRGIFWPWRGGGLHSCGSGSLRRARRSRGGKCRGPAVERRRSAAARGRLGLRRGTRRPLGDAGRIPAFEFRENFFQRRQARGIHHAQQAHFQMQTRIGLAAQIVVGVQQNLKKSREVFFAERFGRSASGAGAGRRARQSDRNRRRRRARRADCGNGRWLRGRNAAGFVPRRAAGARA